MAILPSGYDPQNLEDVLKGQAASASANATDSYIQNKKRLVSKEAASGRLMSGVSDYPLTDLSVDNQKTQSGIQDHLAGSLASVGQEDWLNSQDFQRSYQLAQLIGGLNKPSTLDQIFQGIGSIGGPVASMYGAFS